MNGSLVQTEKAPELDLVLVGGGHAHALVLRSLAMNPCPGLRITLISPAAFTPYSGMLPGLLAGHYSFEETHIDLLRLCQWAGVRFLIDTAEAVDPELQRVYCHQRGYISYDLLSLDIGSQPELDSVPGARLFSTPVKPVAGLWQRWEQLQRGGREDARIAVVGGGAGGVEIAMAMAHRWRGSRRRLALYTGAADVLAGYSAATRDTVRLQLEKLGIALHCQHRVSRVLSDELQFSDAPAQGFDTLIWCTGAAAAPWIAESGLPCDERGFMLVDDTLQSTAYPNVFGAGDIATQHRHPRPKAGVYAVRQAPVLAHNLVAAARGEALRNHRPQRRFLSLLSLGEREAVAERNGISLSGRWAWRWKDRIDRRFMQAFSELPPRSMLRDDTAGAPAERQQAPCGGCGAKVGAMALSAVLEDLIGRYPMHTPEVFDDAVPVDVGQPLLLSTDTLRALIDDPWRMGRVAAQHALSDLYATGARPHSALATITLPFAAAALLQRDLYTTLDGALSILSEADCRLVGGHSMQGPEWQLGLTVTGVMDGLPLLRKTGARPGDHLLLSKPLGGGALFAAQMLASADGRQVAQALELMERSNAGALAAARRCGATALTDVTGFGLAGHLREMLGGALSVDVEVTALPAMAGAVEAMQSGIFSTLHQENLDAVAAYLRFDGELTLPAQLLFDPQTSGGLLMAVPEQRVVEAEEALREEGCCAARIGQLRGADPDGPVIRLR